MKHAKSAAPRVALVSGLLFAIAIGVLWAFRAFWYSNAATQAEFIWLGENCDR